MKRLSITLVVMTAVVLMCDLRSFADDASRLAELDAYWAEVSRAVREGDFAGYKATCHKTGILVSGVKKTSQPLSQALKRWEKDFIATKSGKVKASVEFRFSQRFGDETTAHETGIFLYATANQAGEKTADYIHFEGLLVKANGKWEILMEYQKSQATKQQWESLK